MFTKPIAFILSFFLRPLLRFMQVIMPSPSNNHSEMTPLTEFHYFKQLPPELRLTIWEHHLRTFLGPRIHRIAFKELHVDAGRKPLVGLGIQTFAYRQISPRDKNITRESQTAARWVEWARGTREPVIVDVLKNTLRLVRKILIRTLDMDPESLGFRSRGLVSRGGGLVPLGSPPRFNWAEDMLYLKVPKVCPALCSTPFEFLLGDQGHSPWVGKVQRLAIYLDARAIIGFRPRWGYASETLDERAVPFKSLRELTIVVDRPVPRPATTPDSTTTGPTSLSTVATQMWLPVTDEDVQGPDEFGFVEFKQPGRRRLFDHGLVQVSFALVYLHFLAAWKAPLKKTYGRDLRLRVAVVDSAVGV